MKKAFKNNSYVILCKAVSALEEEAAENDGDDCLSHCEDTQGPLDSPAELLWKHQPAALTRGVGAKKDFWCNRMPKNMAVRVALKQGT